MKLKKLFALCVIASLAFASCKKKGTEDDLNALRAELEKEQAAQQALADSLAAQQQRDSLEDAQYKDGYIKGTFTGTREDDPNTSANEEGQAVSFPFEFKYRYPGNDSFYNYDADTDPESMNFGRYENSNFVGGYFFFNFNMDLPGTLSPSFGNISGRLEKTLSDNKVFRYQFYWSTGYTGTPTFSNVSYANGRLKADYSLVLPAGSSAPYYNNNGATITGSFDVKVQNTAYRTK
ncbi:MAG: hypothetical protein SFU27_00115 [Thermonemataceae bacterium]|nr:hypothetical protein [Thermonemataceae bacterium]